MSEHTETPWEVSQATWDGKHINGTWGGSKNGASVFVARSGATIGKDDSVAEANARHIVHCVNNHERLIEALREFSELDQMSTENAVGFIEDNCRDLRTLLSSLEAEKGGES